MNSATSRSTKARTRRNQKLEDPLTENPPGKIASGNVSRAFGFVKDIVPTLYEAAGIETTRRIV